MKSAKHWLLWLLFLPALCIKAQEVTPGEKVARLLRGADEIRVVQVEDLDQFTVYQCVVPAGNEALAKAFAEATLEPHRGPDGANDPGPLGISSYVVINVRKKGEVVGYIVLMAYLVHTMKPDEFWYTSKYEGAQSTYNAVPLQTTVIAARALELIQASVQQGGGWKKVDANPKEFVRMDPSN